MLPSHSIRRCTALLATGFIAACAAPVQPTIHSLGTRYDPEAVAWLDTPGHSIVHGRAFLPGEGGAVRTCAGSRAFLVPLSDYARSWATTVYGSEQGGFKQPLDGKADKVADLSIRFRKSWIPASCDAQGRFEFTEVPDGEYYVISAVLWKRHESDPVPQGGLIARRVRVSGVDVKEVVLTR